MIKVSELLSKQLICLSTASVAGTISNITFDPRLTRGKLLHLLNEDDTAPEIRFVELKRVSALNEDACVVKTDDCIINEWAAKVTGAANPMNCLGFNQDGKALGKVRDIVLDGVTVSKILLDDASFSPKDLLSYSDSLLIFNDTGKPYKLPHPKVKVPLPKQGNSTVRLHSFNAPDVPKAAITDTSALNQAATPFEKPAFAQSTAQVEFSDAPVLQKPITEKMEKIDVPTKIPQSNTQVSRSPAMGETAYKFLIGKPVHSDIVSADGRVLIASGTLVTEEVIRIARDTGKLVQLALRAF